MTLNEFIDETKHDIERFKEFWLLNRVTDKDGFPDSLDAGEWYEQFLMWCST